MKFTLVHCAPPGSLHGLAGYLEVIEAVEWGLQALGHDVQRSTNRCDPHSRNILFGAQMLDMAELEQLPRDTVVYNFEQQRGLAPIDIRPSVHYCAQHFEIWDYSAFNRDAWTGLRAARVKIVPVGYAPVLSRIPKAPQQDIDVLFVGLPGQKRIDAFAKLAAAGLRVLFGTGVYGQARDSLIARSKIVLNVNLYEFSQIFEVVRVSYLLANRKAVVAVREERTCVEPDFERAVVWTDADEIVEDCARLLNNDDERRELEEAGFRAIAQRDQRTILRNALEQQPPPGRLSGLAGRIFKLTGRGS